MRDERLNMVVVDDNPVLVSVLSEIFRECGHDVRMASDGFIALAQIRSRVPDVLLSDLSMPGMSGYELLSIVRRRFPNIRAVAMSGAHAGRDIPPGVAADAFYPKGESSVAELIQTVRDIWTDDAHSARTSAPVWISEICFRQTYAAALLASCPECLRPFVHRATTSESWQQEICPHCMTGFELAIARPPTVVDGTLLARPKTKDRADHPSLGTKPHGISSGRMHQQW